MKRAEAKSRIQAAGMRMEATRLAMEASLEPDWEAELAGPPSEDDEVTEPGITGRQWWQDRMREKWPEKKRKRWLPWKVGR